MLWLAFAAPPVEVLAAALMQPAEVMTESEDEQRWCWDEPAVIQMHLGQSFVAVLAGREQGAV